MGCWAEALRVGAKARRRLTGALTFALLTLAAATPDGAAASLGPPETPGTRSVMFVGNNWEGTADIIDSRTFARLARINVIPDKEERLAEINTSPDKLVFFMAIRQFVGEGNDQYVDDMFTTHDGRLMAVSRPSFADVVGIDLATQRIVWRFPMEGYRSDHMAVSPDGRKLVVSDSTANKVHELDLRTGRKTGEFPSGDSPHENEYSEDGSRIFHASIGRVYTPTDRPELGLARDTSKGERYFQIVDGRSLEILKRWDMGEKLSEAGYEDMSSAVRPMALAPDERQVYLQVSFHHGFVEFDLESERVLRVAHLPISEEARNTPPELYLLDSAHHGLAMNPQGTKLCVAGTMSDYGALVSRADFSHKLFAVGKKPYWATTGPDGRHCWLSSSGDDQVAVLDYRSERQIATIPVGDHPQRVRAGLVRRAHIAGMPLPPGARDSTAPTVRVSGVPQRCRRRAFRVRVDIADQSSLRHARVSVAGRRLRQTSRRSFRVRVPVRSLRRGGHRLRVRAVDSAGNRTTRTARFSRCVAARTPRYTG
jgi:YVTN family beta-propeller protein